MTIERIKSTLFCFVLVLITISCNKKEKVENTEKQALKVLYVGGSGNWQDKHYENEDIRKQDVTRRMASFENMLNNYFTEVTVLDASAYKQEISNNYDVTIIDGRPEPITPYKILKDSTGEFVKRIPGKFFTKDFTKPILFIAEMGSTMTESVGSKIDWYCLCMDAHAFNLNQKHPIFNSPFSVDITLKEGPVQEAAYRFEHFFDNKTTRNLPMWKVQTKGFKTDKGFRVGLVSRPGGFTDSPESEFISSGICSMRNFDAVAIGRHGNFFHWGFAASPEYMPEEAQTVLANAVHYISKFDGKGIIARKYNRGISTRGQHYRELLYFSDQDVYKEQQAQYKIFNKENSELKKEAERKEGVGEALTDKEKRALNFKPVPEQTFKELLVYRLGDKLVNKLGVDSKAYKEYFAVNKDYFYTMPKTYQLFIDEDVKSLQIPNYDIHLLDACIKMLEQNRDINKAKRILNRYTLLDFETTPEWRSWYENNKEKLFFTEAGGFKFMVNSYDKNVMGNAYPNPF